MKKLVYRQLSIKTLQTASTVKQNDIKQLNLGDYFPTDTSIRALDMYGNTRLPIVPMNLGTLVTSRKGFPVTINFGVIINGDRIFYRND